MIAARPFQVGRRDLLAGGAASLVLGSSALSAEPFSALEARVQGRLGVAAWDAKHHRRLEYRADERFALCSTFKTLLAAAILARVDRGEDRLDRLVPYGRADLVSHAPVTEPNLDKGALSVEALCQAIVEVSDNPAANLLLKSIGGPAGLTAYLRTVGDRTTRLDRYELDLNTAVKGDPRDITTPRAMAAALETLILGDALSPASRARLESWMAASPTGANRLRKHAPSGWRTADKTGTGGNGSTNDLAILRPSSGDPIVVAAYLTETAASLAEREAVLAEVGRLVFSAFLSGAA